MHDAEMPEHWHVVLQTERLVLRRFTVEDADALAALDADPLVRRFVGTGPSPTVEFYRDEKLPEWIAHYERGRFGYWAAHEKPALDFVGWFHLRPDRFDPTSQDLGYRLLRRVWGRGLATEGGRALVEQGCARWGARRITAHCLRANVASRRVMEKCGLHFVREFVVAQEVLPGADVEHRRAVAFAVQCGAIGAGGAARGNFPD